MLIKTQNFAQVCYLENSEIYQLNTSWLLFATKNNKSIYIQQPNSSFGIIPTNYGNSPFFEILQQEINKVMEIRENKTWNYRITGAMFIKNNEVVVSGTQNPNLHQFSKNTDQLCIRETLKAEGKWKSGDSYSICKGCDYPNHAEPQAIEKAKSNGIYDQLKNSTLLELNHWWICDSCTQKLAQAGVKNIILCKSWVKDFLEIDMSFLE
jgi:deoxycytidylate deaminase